MEQSLRGLATPPLCILSLRAAPGHKLPSAELSLRSTWREDGPTEAAYCQQPALSPEACLLRLEARVLPLDELWRGDQSACYGLEASGTGSPLNAILR